MAAAVIKSEDLNQLIETYKYQRETFSLETQKNNFLLDRENLRQLYANARITIKDLNAFLATFDKDHVRQELENRFKEWDKKIILKSLKTSSIIKTELEDLTKKISEFVKNHSDFMCSSTYQNFFESKKNLRSSFIQYTRFQIQIKGLSKEQAIENFKIEYKIAIDNDTELLNRIDREWSWKI
ncbi:MAG: hypothetical protein K1060chlam5_00905 [Candidatus Anoxychlamydiales bacterium]|nr:hypothetical protein [Candidatus Anoxychlamydiales bacterium]